ncbi:MAG: AAA-like domain protein [Deltaproteobacteria bacterium ADurb.Bin135]|jgi:DNA phosphorothioation-dependent restriction protein DptH|nr:MAG: AAA-like domain protein [Deltaproteobacteria bacterium ADurb.Bin135]
MIFYSSSVIDAILAQIKNMLKTPSTDARELRVILPSAPARIVLTIGEALEEYRDTKKPDCRIKLIMKTAYRLGQLWRASNDPEELALFEEIEQRGWYDAENHLTAARNEKRNPQTEDVLVTVLIGSDQVTDQASLYDFYRLDYQTLWEQWLQRTFSPWIRRRLRDASVEAESDHIAFIDEILKSLVDTSLADIIRISDFLESIDLSHAQDGRDAMRVIVESLGYFRLPSMKGLMSAKRKVRIRHYIKSAVEFFNYGSFLDKQGRKKAIQKIDQYLQYLIETGKAEDVDLDDLGRHYKMIQELIEDLKRYIEKKDSNAQANLMYSDFPYILDEILGFRKRKEKGRDIKTRKLTGMPLEVVLRSVWITLAEYKRWTQEQGIIAGETIKEIRIQGNLFRHDCEENDPDIAHQLLRQLIGGLDNYIEEHLAFAPNPREAPEDTIGISCSLCPSMEDGDLAYNRSIRAEPLLEFTVFILGPNKGVTRKFVWPIPKSHPYRNMASMFSWAYEHALSKHINTLPVFCIPYSEELSLAKDEDEVNRILVQALESESKNIVHLLGADGIDTHDKTYSHLMELAYAYGEFIKEAHEEGLFSALNNKFGSLDTVYRKTYKTFLVDPECKTSRLGALLFKAFFMVGEREDHPTSLWIWKGFEPSAIITPLHPALLEMLVHQHSFLSESFETAARQTLWLSSQKGFNERRWTDIMDLAKIQWPIYGTLRNEDQILDTNVKSFGIFHIVGEDSSGDTSLSTKLLLRYDTGDEDDISDEDLFEETRESRLIQRVLEDYRSLYAHADDGLSISAYCGGPVQPVIAGIDAYLRELARIRSGDRPYTVSLILFAETQDDTAMTKWVSAWRERWIGAEYSAKYDYYSWCKISVAHRLIAQQKDHTLFENLISQINVDLSFLVHFVRAGAGGNKFEEIEPYDASGKFRMFPVLEKACCSVVGGGMDWVRERIISNRQFVLGTLHSQVMARLKLPTHVAEKDYIVMGKGDFAPWKSLVDKLHARSTWVVCIDPSVDERLIGKEDHNGIRQREIIGFGSGVGSHGEHNYTISTDFFRIAQVRSKIASHIASKLGPLDHEASNNMASSIISESLHMAGLSLVKATGPSQYVRDYISYALLRKLLPRDADAFCDEIVSLDAFRHWFDSSPNNNRPDLLHLKATIIGGRFRIESQLFECKLAQESETHLEKAREQLQSGLSHLVDCFKPRQGKNEGIDDRPDQRYWWLQLQRLIASKGRVKYPQFKDAINALERLSDGFFTIQWKAAAVTFWTDSDQSNIARVADWEFQIGESSLIVGVISAGRQFVKSLCLDNLDTSLPLGEQSLDYSSITIEIKPSIEINEEKQQAPGGETGSASDNDSQTSISDKKQDVSEPEYRGTIEPKLPQRIFLGQGVQGNRQVFWEFGHQDLANRHILIFGTSGMGKTYAIQALLCELGRAGQNSLIVDYTNGFYDNQLETETRKMLKPVQHIVRKDPLPINPFRRQEDMIGEMLLPEDPSNTAQRVSGVFSEVYEFGDQQKSALYTGIKRGIETHGNEMTLPLLIEELKEMVDENPSSLTVVSKIQPFVDMNPFGAEEGDNWESLFMDQNSRCHILQLAGFLKDASKLITEFTLIDLYWYYRGKGNKDKPRIIILDEIQNLDHDLESPLGKFLTEGRKFGISLIVATQTLSNLKKDEQDRLFQASHKLFFKPADTELRSYAQILENTTNEKAEIWIQRLSRLKKGECYSLGPSLNSQQGLETKAFHIKIESLRSRFKDIGKESAT